MSKRRTRKQERRREKRWGTDSVVLFDEKPNVDVDWRSVIFRTESEAGTKRCGDCREFVESQEPGGRGNCLHPGSGVFAPWNDTEGCAFFANRRGR